MPSFYSSGEYDLAGFAVGAAERDRLLTPCAEVGDVVVGIASSGVHSNGFSLVRHVVSDQKLAYDDPCPFQEGITLGRALLAPTKIYCKALLPLLRDGSAKAFAHITGGGLLENIPRVLKKEHAVHLDASKWEVLPVFRWLAGCGRIAAREMARTFNCGLGGVLIVPSTKVESVLESLKAADHQVWQVGTVQSRGEETEQVLIENIERLTQPVATLPRPVRPKTGKRVAVLISGSGTNLQAIIDNLAKPSSDHAHIVLVISNVAGVKGLERAEKAGIPTKVRWFCCFLLGLSQPLWCSLFSFHFLWSCS